MLPGQSLAKGNRKEKGTNSVLVTSQLILLRRGRHGLRGAMPVTPYFVVIFTACHVESQTAEA
jgi:hypothetical protein